MNKQQIPQNTFYVIAGPTGVGKTACADELVAWVGTCEIVNADVGQLYTPLTIGTAKPDIAASPVVHHLFNELDEPRDYCVAQFRTRVAQIFTEIWQRGNTPIVVGGSLFYVKSLFFNTPEYAVLTPYVTEEYTWDDLNAIDPVRAQAIHPHDRYRINRALSIWCSTGKKPSAFSCAYEPLGNGYIWYLTRDRADLYERINRRTVQMIDEGWPEEVARLSQEWQEFVCRKNIIGYPELINFVPEQRNSCIEQIQQTTRHYAKRQECFWKSFTMQLTQHMPRAHEKIYVLNLTFDTAHVILKKLSDTCA